MNRHRLAEERSRALHRAIVDRIAADSQILELARERVRRWLISGEVASDYARQWEAILSLSMQEICAVLVEDSERARALRQVTPFAGAIDPRTRWRIWREVREALERAG